MSALAPPLGAKKSDRQPDPILPRAKFEKAERPYYQKYFL
jgi:hypothetical protein